MTTPDIARLTTEPAGEDVERVVVPREPTPEMIRALAEQAQKPTGWHAVYPAMWRAALAAAPKYSAGAVPEGWIGWSGGAVPVQGTDARGLILFKGEAVKQAEARGETILDYWPWYGEDEQPLAVAYKLAALHPTDADRDPYAALTDEVIDDAIAHGFGERFTDRHANAHPTDDLRRTGEAEAVEAALRVSKAILYRYGNGAPDAETLQAHRLIDDALSTASKGHEHG